MGHIFHRHLNMDYPVAVGGDGPYIIDKTGKRYLDASGGAAVSCLGHSDADVRAAMHAQIDKIAFAHTGFFTTDVLEELGDFLAARAPDGLDWVYPVSGGSEAMEAAVKVARQYVIEIGQGGRKHIIARRQSYHGATLGTLAVGYHASRRAPYESIMPVTHHVSPCSAYRGQFDGESDADYVERLAGELEQRILDLGANTVLAFVAETVVGATGGVVPPVPGYFKRMREVCDQYGVLLILDEVMCGMGRTGTLFACEQDGIAPDILAVAKGLAGGYQPVGAVLVHDRIVEAIRMGRGEFLHGHTYIGHAMGCAAALAVQKAIAERDLLSNIRTRGEELMAALNARFGQSPHVGDIRGRGLFIGLELVADRAQKTPFEPSMKLNGRIKRHAMEQGLICYPAGGTADGVKGDHILIAPPFIIDDTHVGEIVEKLGAAVDAALGEIQGLGAAS